MKEKNKREKNTEILKNYLRDGHCKKFFKVSKERCKQMGLTMGKMVDAIRALESEGILEQREKNSSRKTYIIHKEKIDGKTLPYPTAGNS